MTTTPLVKSTTDELIEELEAAAKRATNDLWTTDGHSIVVAWSDQANQCYAVAKCEGPDRISNAPYIAACNPENVLALIACIRELERWKSEQLQVMTPVMEYAHSLKIAPLGGSVTQALIDDHKRLRELERDAERYQWLREQDQFHGDTFSALNEWLWANGDFSDITAAIDAEISEQPQCPAT